MRQFPCGQVYSKLYFRKYETCARNLKTTIRVLVLSTVERVYYTVDSTHHGTVFLAAAKLMHDARAATARGFL